MGDKKFTCPICSRVFYEGQGIRITIGGQELTFHSKSCAIKFFKSLILYLDQKTLESAVKMTIKEFEERMNDVKEKRKKKLEAL
ncbi:MAG: hypothetical protein QXJ56_04990 [Ignisphaera sp.]